MFFYLKGDKFKFGTLTLFKEIQRNGYIFYYLFNICIWKRVTNISKLIYKIQKNKSFDVRSIDTEISLLSPHVPTSYKVSKFSKNIAYLASQLYDTGGHSKCLRDLIASLSEKYKGKLFLTRIYDTYCGAPKTIEEIKKYVPVMGSDLGLLMWRKQILELFYRIVNFSPKVIFVFIHPNDIYGSMLVFLISKYTNIKIFYVPHASHLPNLGMNFADLSLEGMSVTAFITQHFRKFPRTCTIGVLSKRKEFFTLFTKEDIFMQRKKIGVPANMFCTMSGGASYKFFENDTSSEYFHMIKQLLYLEKSVYHVVVSNFSHSQLNIINKIFDEDSNLRQRLILLPQSTNYELIFSVADVFIDSFPISCALTMIDLMRLRVPMVVKINRENAIWSFHEYQKKDYLYMFDSKDKILSAVIKLLKNPEERKRVADENFKFYMEKYEGSVCTKKLCNLIANIDNLEQYYDSPKLSCAYNFKDIYI